ncbi:DUF3010 family protein [uncultured Chryseobacterium sp.]|jgi:Protein of unknown function (DUF3010).|uniref:DUF3010 family protein n=1 Tax=uncultured Chryseobacterium sp. TaxID=259322 RepID=UPI00261DCDC9|nr:DUF3010 family protein [uncultured Chryseobacterium sp.]
MKVIAIDIDSSKVILFALEQIDDGTLTNITGNFRSITVKDDYNNEEIREFQATIHSFFDNINPNKIGVIKRMTKGKFSASPVSFKLEGLIQCYKNCDVEFVSPSTLTAYYRKNTFCVVTQYNYQTNSARLAQYLIS